MTDEARRGWLSLERVCVIATLLAMAFAAGINWEDARSVKDEQVKQKQAMERMEGDYVRKDVLAPTMQNVLDELKEIKAQLAAGRSPSVNAFGNRQRFDK